MKCKEYYKAFYEKECFNADFLVKWLNTHMDLIMGTSDGLNLDQFSSLVIALQNYRLESQKKMEK